LRAPIATADQFSETAQFRYVGRIEQIAPLGVREITQLTEGAPDSLAGETALRGALEAVAIRFIGEIGRSRRVLEKLR